MGVRCVQGRRSVQYIQSYDKETRRKGLMNVLSLDERGILRQNLRKEDQKVQTELLWLKIGKF